MRGLPSCRLYCTSTGYIHCISYTSSPGDQNLRLLFILFIKIYWLKMSYKVMWELHTARQLNQTACLMGFYHAEMKPWQTSKKGNICNLHLLMRKGKGYQNRSRKQNEEMIYSCSYALFILASVSVWLCVQRHSAFSSVALTRWQLTSPVVIMKVIYSAWAE